MRRPVAGMLQRVDERDRERIVRPLLDYLAKPNGPEDGDWRGWRIQRIGGRRSNLPDRT